LGYLVGATLQNTANPTMLEGGYKHNVIPTEASGVVDGRVLPAVEADQRLRLPAEDRRWLPLRDGPVLLGALQVESAGGGWPPPLSQRLQAVALCLTEALRLDLDAA
jgi:acetylornithine deacetylase/succinyl-diaminopimelate desuccinylase-like protein